MNKGKVYLIGAGPGDPELLTLKGKRCLGEADVIVGDYLADKRILKFAKPDAEYIYVGKKVGCHTMKQHEISELLAEKGREGKIVARLKGGDPFVFGRGGEIRKINVSEPQASLSQWMEDLSFVGSS